LNKRGTLIGYNTDGIGAIEAIEKKLKKIKKDDRVVVFGAGGAARAIIFELYKRCKNITVINRSLWRRRLLEKDFLALGIRLKVLPLNQQTVVDALIKANFVINATSVGMSPRQDKSLLSPEILKMVNQVSPIRNKFFFDTVFNPPLTKFLLEPLTLYQAEVCFGLYMMIYQGINAFRIWTGRTPNKEDVKTIFNLLERAIFARDDKNSNH